MLDRRLFFLRDNDPSVASELLRPLLNVLSAAREICGGDMDKYLILLALSMRMSQHPDFKILEHDRIIGAREGLTETARAARHESPAVTGGSLIATEIRGAAAEASAVQQLRTSERESSDSQGAQR